MATRGQYLHEARFDEFVQLTDERLAPLLRQFGFQAAEPPEGFNRYCKRRYVNGDRSVEVYHEILENYTSISLHGPDHRSSDLAFICRWMGRGSARNVAEFRRPFSEHLENYIRLINDHLSDVLSGATPYRFSDADFDALLAISRATEQDFREEMKKRLADLEFTWQEASDREVRFSRPRSGGSVRLSVSTSVGFYSVSADASISVRFDRLEELYREVYAAAHGGQCPFGLDISSIYTRLYALEGDEFKHLDISENLSAADAARQLAADIVRLGEPFFQRMSDLGQFFEFSEGEAKTLPGYSLGIFEVERLLCTACLIGRFSDIPEIFARESIRLEAIDEYGGDFVHSLRSIADALRQRFPQLSLAKH